MYVNLKQFYYYFYFYPITVFPIFPLCPSPLRLTPHSHSQSLHCCPCPCRDLPCTGSLVYIKHFYYSSLKTPTFSFSFKCILKLMQPRQGFYLKNNFAIFISKVSCPATSIYYILFKNIFTFKYQILNALRIEVQHQFKN